MSHAIRYCFIHTHKQLSPLVWFLVRVLSIPFWNYTVLKLPESWPISIDFTSSHLNLFSGVCFFTSNLLSSAVKAYHHYWRLRKIPILPNTRPGFRQNGAQWNNCHKWWEGIWHEIILGFTSIFHRMDTSHSIFYLYRNPAYPLIVCCFFKSFILLNGLFKYIQTLTIDLSCTFRNTRSLL